MKKGVLIQPLLDSSGVATRVTYKTEPYKIASGIVRAFQRFAAIALTTVGTDALRPWFGTRLTTIVKMNVRDKTELDLLVRDELRQAITQFFTLQSQENSLEDVDIITAIDVMSVVIDDYNRITATLRFTPANRQAVYIPLEVS